ncbi:MAG: hypothetical protein GC203_01795 [Phenylobacterium sp.]|uniref:hypothetical protein n=1 Tax=Phenylobacterium sp. TaxID=1871053 RepID=UPI0025E3DB89|nr:hypothetical protein [Phenylobacterium sp.]MBI1196578.1 hypothetical protein [Phenylobacterium sp.]
MSISRTNSVRRTSGEHFEPDESIDHKAQRHLRGLLEKIDYTAYSANRRVLGQAIGAADVVMFERLGLAAAVARARWVATALAASDPAHPPTRQQIDELAFQRAAFEELSEAYEALRRMVERGYLAFPEATSDEA